MFGDPGTVMSHGKGKRAILGAVMVGAMALVAVPIRANAAQPASHARATGTINIGAKNFDEEYITADIYQLLLQKAGFTVKQHVLGSEPQPFQKALLNGSLDLYPEYTGTGLVGILGKTGIVNPHKAYQTVKRLYEKKFHLTWLQQTPMNDSNAVAVTKATANKYHLKTLSNLAKVSKNLSFAALPPCKGRPDCLGGMQKQYGINFKNVTYVDSTTLTLQALKSGQADAAEVFGTDGRISAYGLVSLVDNKGKVFPADHIAPVVRDSTLKKYPQIRGILNKVAPLLTTKVVIQLNLQYDLHHVDAMKLATGFLKSHHLI